MGFPGLAKEPTLAVPTFFPPPIPDFSNGTTISLFFVLFFFLSL